MGAQGRSRAGRGRTRRRLEVAALVVTMVFSIVLNGAGPLSAAAVEWNRYPVPIQQDPYRIFDWSRPHFACALYPPLLYDDR